MKNRRLKAYNRKMKATAIMLLFTFFWQLLQPTVAMALTTGPSQPEVQGFEPVGTTDMVDMFSGSFVYNIPLLDVEGYPVNISYHGGVTMEQEASWVGLGWNINPGTINRTIRGIPDDFNGDTVFKDFHIKGETTLRVGIGFGAEFFGVGDPNTPPKKTNFGVNANVGINLNISNYKGVSCDLSLGGGINVFHCASAGVNIGVGSQTGAAIDYNAGLSMSLPNDLNDNTNDRKGLGVNVGGGYNTRSGLKDLNLSFSISDNSSSAYKDGKTYGSVSSSIQVASANVPIGVKNYVPVITNSSTMSSVYGRVKFGGALWGIMPYGDISAMYNVLQFNNDASRSAYGYMYLQNANLDHSSILDFTRDKDGMFNKSMQYLPPPNMTYDIYSVSGQGTGGSFRPFRNDFGNVYDPLTTSSSTSNGGEAEGAIGNLFEVGLDYTNSSTQITSGPWLNYQRSGTLSKGFTKTTKGSIYENTYFKQAGELTEVNPDYYDTINGTSVLNPDAAMNLPKIKPGSDTQRDPRANLIYYHTAQEDTITGVGTNPNIVNYANDFSHFPTPLTNTINRIGTGNFQRKKDHISEIVQVQKDGRKYIYGLPAMNNVQREVTCSVDPANANLGDGTVSFSGAEASVGNSKGRDNYYSSTITPSYAHSYLLTDVLSSDFVDITGNGPSDDDLGSFTKFNYTRTDSDYRWIAPYSASMNMGQYNPGFWSDPGDDKGSFVCGSREQWYLHSIETKNFIAEFYTSSRNDAQGISFGLGISASHLNSEETNILNGPKDPSLSYKLDSIKLYNKHDRFINGTNAIPVKSVYFVYNYGLCSGVPNTSGGGGKLTLQKIYFSYGNSQRSMISPYQFGYGYNPNYSLCSKNRWGDYKPNNSVFTNYEYPYVNQNDTANNTYASAWSLTNITLPSGGVIQANYESNDYAYVQDQTADEMFMVQGLGNSSSFVGGNQLFKNDYTPCLYAYFLRRPSSELSKLSFAQNYLGTNFQLNGKNCLYFNFNVRLTGANNTYEQIKGYGKISDFGICGNDTLYGYIKFAPVVPTGTSKNFSPVTYTALNVGRYNLPQVIFPGTNPNETDYHNVIAGLKESFNELFSLGSNPIMRLIKQDGGQFVNLNKSFIRLQSVGLAKKGGGQRVKSLTFSDHWNSLAGGNDSNAVYGKNYNYTINDSTYGIISSGVAIYEPLIGGDENPLRQPVDYYETQSGTNWPPNDPVDLYQESPIGESLFPGAQVGYSQVTVTSIHADKGKSSQGVDQYLFYTCKDFPAQVSASAITAKNVNYYDFFTQSNILTATQGYTLIFNDMHGKPRKVEHDVYNPSTQTFQPISYQIFNYKQNNGQLNNEVPCLTYNGTNMIVKYKQLGVEEDVTLDSRQKDELTTNTTANGNFNFFSVGIFPIGIRFAFIWGGQYENKFQSAVVTKVVQQYGILDNVISFNEGAVTTMQNEIYDSRTGQPVVTSVTNEFQDKEYTTNIPASWVYKGMGSSYSNILYKDTGTITIDKHLIGTLNITNTAPLVAGDELSISYTDASNQKHNTTAYVLGIVPVHDAVDSVTEISSHLVYDTVMTVTPHLKYCFGGNVFADSAITVDLDSLYGSGTADSFYYNGSDSGTFTIVDTCITSYSPYVSYPVSISSPRFFSYLNITYADDAIEVTWFYDWKAVTSTGFVGPGPDGYGLYGSIVDSGYSFPFFGSYSPTYSGTINDTSYYPNLLYRAFDTSYPVLGPGACTGLNVLPRFPLNTPGWVSGAILSNVTIQVISSGQKNMLNENVESYTSMDFPVNLITDILNTSLTNVINLKAKTFSDSNTMIPPGYINNPDTINPFIIGERGLWREYCDYDYLTNRNYLTTTTRNMGLFKATSFFAQPSGLPSACFLSPYNFLAPSFTDPNWHRERTVTKYTPYGKEVENIDAVGNYSTAVYGYNQELPVAVASNSKQGEILTDGFEDYNLLIPTSNVINYIYSPFNNFGLNSFSSSYNLYNLSAISGLPTIDTSCAHSGTHSLLIPASGSSTVYNLVVPNNGWGNIPSTNNYNIYYSPLYSYVFTAQNLFLPFEPYPAKTYMLSYWIKQSGATPNITDYPVSDSCGVLTGSGLYPLIKKSNIIDGWQQVEVTFSSTISDSSIRVLIPAGFNIDDVRIFPSNANMKSFVYNPVSEKLMATLDENNFATFYEYDQEGNLVRVKKETTKGIMTISESRSGNQKL